MDYGKARWSLLRLDHRPAGRGWGCGGGLAAHDLSAHYNEERLAGDEFEGDGEEVRLG